MLVIRGELSDILSTETLDQMQMRHPRCATLTVRGQGHAPLLKDAGTIGSIRSFLASVDENRPLMARWTV
jgi:hypothetical protein